VNRGPEGIGILYNASSQARNLLHAGRVVIRAPIRVIRGEIIPMMLI